MRKLLNALYVTTQGAYLRKEGLSVVVDIERETRARVPLHNLEAIVCFGNVLCSPFLLGACADAGLAVSFLTENGRYLAGVAGPAHGNVLLRREQYRRADDDALSAEIMRSVIAGKLVNSRCVLLRARREAEGPTPAIDRAESRLKQYTRKLAGASSADALRGYEGEAARSYFSAFGELVRRQRDTFAFARRSRRPPRDPINALLSLAYTLLYHDVTGAVQAQGLDPSVGYLHRDRPGRQGLALDLMEELRPWWADRLVLSLVNREQIKARHVEQAETGAVSLTDEGRKIFLTAYQERKHDELTHPFLGERVALGLVPHLQALLFARHLRGDLDAYPPFVWR